MRLLVACHRLRGRRHCSCVLEVQNGFKYVQQPRTRSEVKQNACRTCRVPPARCWAPRHRASSSRPALLTSKPHSRCLNSIHGERGVLLSRLAWFMTGCSTHLSVCGQGQLCRPQGAYLLLLAKFVRACISPCSSFHRIASGAKYWAHYGEHQTACLPAVDDTLSTLQAPLQP